MKDKILALLTARFSGVRKDGLARLATALSLQAETEDEIGPLVEKLTLEKVNEFITDYRKDVDKEVQEGNRTFETNLKKKFDFVEKKGSDPGKSKDPKDPDETDIAAIVAAAVKSAVEPLQQKLESFEGSRTRETRLQQLKAKLKDLPDAFVKQKEEDFQFMNFETDQSFAEYLQKVDTGILQLRQELANKGMAGHSKPLMGGPNKEGVSTAVADYIDQKTRKDNPLEGKSLF